MAISLVKQPTGNPSFNLLKKPPRRSGFNIGFDEAPGGLVPLGDTGLWITPDEPADPQDCERYEGSAFCTPFFFTLTPVSLVPAIVIDACNIGIRLDGSLGFIRVPPVAIVYRDPSEACKIPPPPTASATPSGSGMPVNNCSLNGRTLVVTSVAETITVRIQAQRYSGNQDGYQNLKVTSIECPYLGDVQHFYSLGGLYYEDILAKVNFTFEHSLFRDEGFFEYYGGTGIVNDNSSLNDYFFVAQDGETNIQGTGLEGPIAQVTILPTREAEKLYSDGHYHSTELTEVVGEENVVIGYTSTLSITNFAYACIDGMDGHSSPPPPPEDNPPPRKCCMSCCPSQGEQDNSLLNLLIQKVDKLSSIVGVDDYPISLPTSLISKDEGFLGNLIPNGNMNVPSLTRVFAWYIERFDEIMGQWEIPIEVKDSDPSKPGDQPLGIKLPNMAEAIAEMFTLAFQTNLNSETLLNFAVRTAAETVTDKQQNFITYKLLQSMTEWAGYKQKDIKLKMPTLFSLGKTRYDEILNESEIDVPCVDFDEKFGLEADLMRFREAVAILQANYKRKVNPSGDVKAQILKHLLDTFASVNKVNGEEEDDDFEKFLTDVENGFITTPGVNETIKPYGRPYTERPRIRDLTNLEPPTNP